MHPLKSWLRHHYGSLLALFIGVLVPLFIFGSLAEEVVEHEVFSFDKPILLFIHADVSPLLDSVMLFFTRAGSAFVLVPFNFAVFVVLLLKRRAAARFWFFSVAGAGLLNLFAKNTFTRIRPDLWISRMPETTYSFPSGHAMQSMAVTVALIVLTRSSRWNVVVIVCGSLFVTFVGLSRIYWGVHYPSDVLAGWAASLAWVSGLSTMFRDSLAIPKPVANSTE
ncbi:membrane-associated phospholipid phosphatase [Undibacterium sp. GrIS 1.2]|uniref:phosphatase PAP2 family protein n=1 Tax=Undibacterium sp. GrIS 1.2 TaxID=3143933 RepID=UPI00339AFE85